MSSKLMDTEAGGEGGQYEGNLGLEQSHKKSGGQLSNPQTTDDPSSTSEAAQKHAERGERTAENMRYGQTISEGGMGGMTEGTTGEAASGEYGRVQEQTRDEADGDAVAGREASGYGGKKDMDKTVGA